MPENKNKFISMIVRGFSIVMLLAFLHNNGFGIYLTDDSRDLLELSDSLKDEEGDGDDLDDNEEEKEEREEREIRFIDFISDKYTITEITSSKEVSIFRYQMSSSQRHADTSTPPPENTMC